MENKKEEQMIYIKDLIFAALRAWKAVLAVALMIALLLGGSQILTGLSGSGQPVNPEAQTQYEEELAAQEKLLEIAKSNKENYQTYLGDSLFMQLDPYCHYEATVSIYVQTDYQIVPGMSYQNPDAAKDILKAYEQVLQSDAFITAMAETLQTQNQYVSELLTAKTTDQTNTLVFTVKLPTQEAGQPVLKELVAQIEKISEQIGKTVGKHDLTITEQSVAAKVDTDVAEAQTKRRTRATELDKAVTEAQTNLAKVVPPAAQKAGSKAVLKKASILGVLGAVVGGFLTICAVWVVHITSNKIYAARNLTNRTGIKVIGTVGCKKKNPVDRLIFRMEGRSEETVETSPVAVDVCCRLKAAKRLLITGTADQKKREELAQAISKEMPDLQVTDHGSILRSAEALKALSACDAVILVETNGISTYADAKRHADIVCDYEKELLGCILFER